MSVIDHCKPHQRLVDVAAMSWPTKVHKTQKCLNAPGGVYGVSQSQLRRDSQWPQAKIRIAIMATV